MSTINQVKEWAHAHPATNFMVATFRLNRLMTSLTAQDIIILIVLLTTTCYLLPIPRTIWGLVRFLIVWLKTVQASFMSVNSPLQQVARS